MPTPFDAFGYTDGEMTVTNTAASVNLPGLSFGSPPGGGRADSSARRVDFINTFATIRRLLEGDHWLDGAGWIGPQPREHEDGFHETMRILAQSFVSQNALADVVDRHVAGVLGIEPRWGLSVRRHLKKDEKPSDAEQELIDEAEAFVTEWWDARKVHTLLTSATRTLVFARRGIFRLFVPKGKLESANVQGDDGRTRTVRVVPVDNGDISGALNVIWPDTPSPDRATVAEDPDSKEHVAVVLYAVGQNVQGTGSPSNVAELSYLSDRKDANGKPITITRIARQGGRGLPDAAATAQLRLGGRLPVYEMQRPAFVSPQMIQQQRALNLALTALPRNVITAGWLERVIANAQMPGKWVKDAESALGKRWVSEQHTTGAGVTTYLKGLVQKDLGTGSIAYATPSVSWREPSPTDPTIEAAEATYRTLLREARQEHILAAQAPTLSGKSREQSRADYEMTLRPTAAEVNGLGRWLIETLLAMAEEFAQTPGKYTGELRATFECVIHTGPVTAEERTSIDASAKAGTLSLETAMQLEGVADTAAELARLQSQPGADLAIAERQLTAIGAAVANGLDLVGAAEAVGMDADEAEALVPDLGTGVDQNGNTVPATDPGSGPVNGDNPGTDPAGGTPPAETPPAETPPRTRPNRTRRRDRTGAGVPTSSRSGNAGSSSTSGGGGAA